MIIYRVTVEVNNNIEIDWLKWMKEIHIPDVIKTGYFFDWNIEKQILPDNSLDKTIYIINYYANTISDYQKYFERDATRLQEEHNKKYSGKFQASRIILETLPK